MNVQSTRDAVRLYQGEKLLFAHTLEQPGIYVGMGREEIDMYRGNFHIRDHLERRVPLEELEADEGKIRFYTPGRRDSLLLTWEEKEGRIHFHGVFSGQCNRIWLRFPALPEDSVFGGGEQFSYLDLRGKRFEIFTREQGVGRNKKEYVTFLADQEKAGGDYDWTFFPQPTFLSSQNIFFHLENTCYSALDFTADSFHEVELWDREFRFVLGVGESPADTLRSLSGLLGHQPPLPSWAFEGIWLGIQGGPEVVDQKLNTMKAQGADVTAVWCQDWEGVRYTSFGKRLRWDWMADEALYPNLREHIARWEAEGVRFMGYINPYVCVDGKLFTEAREKGLLALKADGQVYAVDFGEFDCGIVDFTNPEACRWYKEVIKKNLLGIGLKGWMADFGEYLPTDCVLFSGESAMTAHNRWPAMWAKINYEALEETGNLGKVAVFFRAGAAGSQKYAPLMWAGDQNVDWSLDDGLASVVVAALSAGMSGHGMHTSDVGGYTTLYHMKRTKELLMRWAEFCAFTPVLRTHEGNRPDSNWQFDSDEETARHVARCSRLHTALTPYILEADRENRETGIPAMRPLFLEYPEDRECYRLKYQYLLGRDLLVAPVYTQEAQTVEVYIPDGNWRSIWDDAPLSPGWNQAPAPMGRPAVFYRQDSGHKELFTQLRTI